MSRKEDDKQSGMGDLAAMLSVLDSNTSTAAANAPLPPFVANALQQLSAGQLSFLDPNMMMISNAAATIAAVAASAVQQMNQGGSGSASSSVTVGSNGAPSLTPALLASLRNALSSQNSSASSVQPQIAALLAATGGGRLAMQLQGQTAAPVPSSLHHLLSHVEATKPKPPPAPPSSTSTRITSALMHSGMQTWTLDQLEKHASLLQQMNQPIPQSVALLLADAQRREKKRTAKRTANRKSASTSRARKKALVEEMTRTNARLKRQALILSLLPDLIVATSLDGEINFCSAQVERILGHKPDDLVGVQLDKLLVPSSKELLQKVFKRLANPGNSRKSHARRGLKRRQGETEAGEKTESKSDGQVHKQSCDANGRRSLQSWDANPGKIGTNTPNAAIISEKSFPLSVVKVESKHGARRKEAEATANPQDQANSNENLDNSTSNTSGSNNGGPKEQVSSLSNGTGLSQSPADSPSEDDGAQGEPKGSKRSKTDKKGKQQSSSDDLSSLSSDAKNVCKANDNLNRNVRWHNQRMMEESGHKDDVTGASVTANNASARLSSLKHVPSPVAKKVEKSSSRYENDQSSSDDSLLAGVEEKKKVGDASDDSGYRESNDSREETSSSGSDSLNAKERRKPLAPTCRLLLIRSDLTTVWCEVTSSLRTRSPEEDPLDIQMANLKSEESVVLEEPKKEPVSEFLLCFRPMWDGDKKADESLRLVLPRATSDDSVPVDAVVSSGNDSHSIGGNSTTRPPKKRSLDDILSKEDGKNAKKSRMDDDKSEQASETEKSVVESLMLMNKSQQ